ncbi:MAG: hypothetical protein ACI4RA_02345 [Kiritimatiellia bacterium]
MGDDRSNVWPILIIALAVLAAGVWKLAPVVRAWIPPAAIDALRASAERCFSREAAEAPVPTADAEAPAPTPIAPASPQSATWGVLCRETTVKALKGRKPIGVVKGGRFFQIDRRTGIDGETVFVGNFTPQSMDELVFIPEEALFCLTGSPDDLTAEQRAGLRPYFELEGEVAKIADKYMLDVAARSPFAKDAAAALKQLRKLQKTAPPSSFATDDERHAAFYEISSLRLKVQELNRRHKEWKDQHAAEFPDPEKDPAVQDIRRRQRAYRPAIRSLLGE